MGVRRTREQKERASIRREESAYVWQPQSAAVAEKPLQKAVLRAVPSPVSEAGFQLDLKRTLFGFLACLFVLTVVYILRG